jgi:hypothetical protein
MDQSPRFALPFLVPGQAQKELLHNEALQLVEMLLCPVVKSTGSAVRRRIRKQATATSSEVMRAAIGSVAKTSWPASPKVAGASFRRSSQ